MPKSPRRNMTDFLPPPEDYIPVRKCDLCSELGAALLFFTKEKFTLALCSTHRDTALGAITEEGYTKERMLEFARVKFAEYEATFLKTKPKE